MRNHGRLATPLRDLPDEYRQQPRDERDRNDLA
jgi:hypothetical protein